MISNQTISVSGKRWQIATPEQRLVAAIAQSHELNDVVARILAARGVDPANVDEYLHPKLRQMPDPSGLADMNAGVRILADAIQSGKKIGILGDYDVDGATSTALMQKYIQTLGGETVFHIPNRFTEGYGPSALGFDRLIELGAEIIVTVDCGITAADLIGEYASRLPIIIVDHHLPGPELPRAAAVINPNRFDCSFDHKYLAACGVVFLLLVALNRELRGRGFFTPDRAEPDLKNCLDLVALGTVADIVPLRGLNRIFVRSGLEILARRGNVGLRALADVARLDGKPDAYHLGFLLGPRINAAGRLKDAGLGVQLLMSNDDMQSRMLAEKLNELNAERQKIEEQILFSAIDMVEQDGQDLPIVIAANENWHPGVIGIVASRLKDRYHKPSFVIAWKQGGDGGWIGTGSARSVTGFNLGNAVVAAQQAGILQTGGGHAMAAGFKIERGRIGEFREFIAARFNQETANGDLQPVLAIDAAIAPGGLNADMMRNLKMLEPFGMGNPQPRFALQNVQIKYASVMKEKHLRLKLQSMDGASIDAVAFRVMDNPLGKFLLHSGGAQIHVAGTLRENNFNGRTTLQFQIEDAASV